MHSFIMLQQKLLKKCLGILVKFINYHFSVFGFSFEINVRNINEQSTVVQVSKRTAILGYCGSVNKFLNSDWKFHFPVSGPVTSEGITSSSACIISVCWGF